MRKTTIGVMGGCVADDGSVPLDISPLFETVDDLRPFDHEEFVNALLADD